jgi:hypothetical protein
LKLNGDDNNQQQQQKKHDTHFYKLLFKCSNYDN